MLIVVFCIYQMLLESPCLHHPSITSPVNVLIFTCGQCFPISLVLVFVPPICPPHCAEKDENLILSDLYLKPQCASLSPVGESPNSSGCLERPTTGLTPAYLHISSSCPFMLQQLLRWSSITPGIFLISVPLPPSAWSTSPLPFSRHIASHPCQWYAGKCLTIGSPGQKQL